MAIRSPEVLGARSCVHAHSESVTYESKKCAKHHEMPMARAVGGRAAGIGWQDWRKPSGIFSN